MKTILLASYPRSGNTWIGYMLAALLGARYEELGRDARPTSRKDISALIDGEIPRSQYSLVYKTHATYEFIDRHYKVIGLVRNPCDVAVSSFFYYYKHIGEAMPKWPWKRTVVRTAREWSAWVKAWTARDVFFIRYEDFNRDAATQLKKVADYLEVSWTDEQIKETMDVLSFENLSEGRRKRGELQNSAFYRRGVVGDYKNYFTGVDHAIMRFFTQKEMAYFGYL